MKRIKQGIMLMSFLVSLPATVFAEEAKIAAETAPASFNAWRDCGIGAMIFDETPMAAIISNVYWDSGTTALTSAAGSRDTCFGKTVIAASYIHETYSRLEEETAKGKGQHVAAMLTIMGCGSQSHADIIGSVRNEFAKSVNDASFGAKTTAAKAEVYNAIVQNKIATEYAAQCQII
ncbi:MAG: DUF3015 domain-containing protein [Gammaproteobacteria bacterium]|nr:DUF3015 domain-containing protein [Gammaproteobacteria bacterium]